MCLKINGFKLNLRGTEVKVRDPLLRASGESKSSFTAFQRTTELDPDVSLMFRVTCMQGINSHLGEQRRHYAMSSHAAKSRKILNQYLGDVYIVSAHSIGVNSLFEGPTQSLISSEFRCNSLINLSRDAKNNTTKQTLVSAGNFSPGHTNQQ